MSKAGEQHKTKLIQRMLTIKISFPNWKVNFIVSDCFRVYIFLCILYICMRMTLVHSLTHSQSNLLHKGVLDKNGDERMISWVPGRNVNIRDINQSKKVHTEYSQAKECLQIML